MLFYRDVAGALETSVIFQNGGNFQNRRRDATNVKMARNNSKQPRISLKMPIKQQKMHQTSCNSAKICVFMSSNNVQKI